MKKTFTYLRTLLVGLMAVTATGTAWADETELDPVGVFTWTNTPAISYDGAATSWAINQGGVSDGKIGKYAGPYAIVKFDASTILSEKTLLTATLDFDITAGAFNSSINIAQLADASFDPATVTTGNFDTSATQFQSGDWSTKNSTVHFSYDVKDRVSDNNVLAFAIYTYTGREQTLKNVKLKLNYSTGEVSKYNYSLDGYNNNDSYITTFKSGEEYETNSVNTYFPYMFYHEGVLFQTAQTPYGVTLDKDQTTSKVVYSEASNDIVAYMEGEGSTAGSGENTIYSNGKFGYAAGNKTQALATLPAGKYTVTIYLVANGNRSIVIRNTAISDVEANTIVSLPITKTSSAGVYTSDEFTLTATTTIGYSGYTSGTKTNQSADIDYIYVTRTGDATEISATITSAGWATLYTDYALDFSGVAGLTAYTATVSENTVTLTEVTNVPAGTGVVLQGTEGNYTIPVIDSSTTDQGDLQGSTSKATTADGTQYVLAMNNEGNAQFAPATSGTIAAGKAYLVVAGGGESRLNVVIAGETTGIKAIEAQEAQEGIINLQGQRVAKAQKGLYIVNGKKAIVK